MRYHETLFDHLDAAEEYLWGRSDRAASRFYRAALHEFMPALEPGDQRYLQRSISEERRAVHLSSWMPTLLSGAVITYTAVHFEAQRAVIDSVQEAILAMIVVGVSEMLRTFYKDRVEERHLVLREELERLIDEETDKENVHWKSGFARQAEDVLGRL